MSAHESAQGMKVMAATRGIDETMDPAALMANVAGLEKPVQAAIAPQA